MVLHIQCRFMRVLRYHIVLCDRILLVEMYHAIYGTSTLIILCLNVQIHRVSCSLLLRKEGIVFRTTAEFESVRTLKEKVCYLANNPIKEESVDTEQLNYVLPDGSSINVGPARFRAPEILFKPDLIGEECEGLHEVLIYSILKSDLDLRKVLFKNIVLSGGSTLFKVCLKIFFC